MTREQREDAAGDLGDAIQDLRHAESVFARDGSASAEIWQARVRELALQLEEAQRELRRGSEYED